MATYMVRVEINTIWVKRFNQSRTNLCFSFGVADTSVGDGLNFNVVVAAVQVAQNVHFVRTDDYAIAAGKQSFSAGTEIAAFTNTENINFKQVVEVDNSFLLKPAQDDQTLGLGHFAFKNDPVASAYLYKQISRDGQAVFAPFYVSKNGPNPPGRSILTPKPVTRLFFANTVKSGEMIEDYQPMPFDVDLTARTQVTVKYDANGRWSLLG